MSDPFWAPFLASLLAAWPAVDCIDAETLGVALALSSGALIHVGATHLLPRAGREPRRFSLIALGAGILMVSNDIRN